MSSSSRNTSASSFLVEKLPSEAFYEQELSFVRPTGLKSSDYVRFKPDNPNEATYNDAAGSENNGQKITFSTILTSNWYQLREAEIIITVFLRRRDHGTAGISADRTTAFLPECIFNRGYIKIGGTTLLSGNKNYLHLSKYIRKMTEYSIGHSEVVSEYEMLFPDGGLDARPNKVPYIVTGKASTIASSTVNVIQVGVQGGAGIQANSDPVDVSSSLLPDGNAYLELSENPYYNKGYTKRRAIFNTGTDSSDANPVTFSIKLKHLFPSLEAFGVYSTKFPLEIQLERNPDSLCFQTAGPANASSSGGEPKVWIKNIELQIPLVVPNDSLKLILEERYLKNTVTRRKFVDVDVIISPSLVSPNATATNAEFPNAISRRPIGALVGYRYVSDRTVDTVKGVVTSPYNGNQFRFYNPNPSRARATIGSQLFFPNNSLYGNGQYANYNEYYRDFLKLMQCTDPKSDMLIKFSDFKTHKFFIPFYFRDIDETAWNSQSSYNINIEVVHDPLPDAADSSAVNAATAVGAPRTGNTEIVLFLFVEREIEVTEGPMGMSVNFDVVPKN